MTHSMTVPLFALLGFAVWTLAILVATIGVHRWSLILTKRAGIHTFSADAATGPDWYRRATRAHANCIENLPVFSAIVAVASFTGVESALLDALSIAVLGARICQSSVHIAFTQGARAVSVRFSFFTVQLLSMFWMVLSVIQIG